MFSEDDLLPISALQHLLFCERQCALIHIEGLWAENRLTVEGNRLHNKTHGYKKGPRGGGMIETRRGVRTVRSLPLRSFRLGLVGVADVVEFSDSAEPFLPVAGAFSDSQTPAAPPNRSEPEWLASAASESNSAPIDRTTASRLGTPLPVEYKRGRPKTLNWDRVQVCAQALCLEEMLGVPVPDAAIYYGAIRHRECVQIDPPLRRETEAAAARLRAMIASGVTPSAVHERKCQRCSLINLCLPRVTTGTRSAVAYLCRAIRAADDPEDVIQ